MTTARIGDPITHRRVLGPIAARRLEVRIAHLPGDEAWIPLRGLVDSSDGAFDTLVSVGAFCADRDVEHAVALARGLLAPGGRLVFLEHVCRAGRLAFVQRLVDPVWSSLPPGCHVDHDLPAALRRGGFLVSDLERCTMPSVVPLLRPWVQGVALVRS